MLEYLKKFNNLPADLKDRVSNKEAMAVIESLEKKYQIALAALVMKIMVKEVALESLVDYLKKENLSLAQADELARELKEKIFLKLGDYFLEKKEAIIEEESKVKGASFFFSPEDEDEIRELAKNISKPAKPELGVSAGEEKLTEIINRAQINFGSAELSERFKKILSTYLRGIRNRVATKLTLTKPFSNGGLNFDDDSADKVLLLADKVINAQPGEKIIAPPKIKLPEQEKQALPERDTPYDFSKLKDRAEKIKADLKKLDTTHELSAPTANQGRLAPVKPEITPKPEIEQKLKLAAKKIEVIKPEQTEQMPLIKRRFEAENLSQNAKAKIEDVKYVPKVMGPIDEIKYMDLISWHRLGGDPFKNAEKIKNKLELLEEESYGKKLEGVKAWRLSPIFKLYLEIGSLSISENKPIDVIIEERKMAGKEYLTADEFKAIMDLNKTLRY